jgi:CheY-like chemotaxis protein
MPEPQPGGAGGTVLIVEDEPAMREVTRRILSRSGPA